MEMDPLEGSNHNKGSDDIEGPPRRETNSPLLGEPKEVKEMTENKVCKIQKGTTYFAVILSVVAIAIVIAVSVFLCTAKNDDDDDEKHDQSNFKLQQHFNGSFNMPYLSSNETLGLKDVQKKLAGLYKSSPALGRFFKEANTSRLRPDSSIIQYTLTFVFPEEQQKELRDFTLGWEMVYNVFRQYLYDQDKAETENVFIEPSSLKMDIMQQ